MRDGEWRTLGEISEATGHPEASVSARLRDFRKPRFGGHTVNRRRGKWVGGSWWEYQLLALMENQKRPTALAPPACYATSAEEGTGGHDLQTVNTTKQKDKQ